ncbi:MAG: molecular chaperone DnaJ [Clostridia bacterium]|nr:molecular chaperone DnaJ [Clostridia bacterium]
MADKRDYYEVLGLSKSASDDEIKKAYRKLAKKYHPDMNPGDKAAEESFKEVNEAYAVLSDPDKKSKYDQFGHSAFDPSMGGSGFGGAGFGGFDFGDIFSSMFGGGFGGGGGSSRRNGPMRGDDLQYRLTLTFDEAYFGCKKDISYGRVEKCSDCGGSGASKGTSPETCPNCGGRGQVNTTQRTPFGVFQSTTTCDTCRGTGKIIKNPCKNCNGKGYVKIQKKLTVSIPAGIDNGETLRVTGQGNDGRNGGGAGDLYVTVNVRPHQIFEREGTTLFCEIPITFVEAALGAEIDVPTMTGSVKFNIPEGTQTGTRFTVKGEGVVSPRNGKKGDLVFETTVEVPKNLSEKQKDALRMFAEECGQKNYQKKQSFFKKSKK